VTDPTPDHVDVLIVGAGLSGIGAACHLRAECPGKTFVVLEARGVSGGTWDLFRYPGVRSDSDMFTLGYVFEPWTEAKAIADGPSILHYIRETARRRGIDRQIRYHRKAVHASWSSDDDRWTVEVQRTDTGDLEQITCSFLYANTGYYRYDEGYTPQLPGVDRYRGRLIHPQHWPEDLDYDGQRIVVIGSGATAVTLVPALAERADHVTMLQRSPTYIISIPERDPIADALRRILPAKVAYPIVRWKNVVMATLIYQLSRRAPKVMKGLIRKGAEKALPTGYDLDTHFTPRYEPWDQRLCLVPDGDLFETIASGRASVVTARIDTFTEHGVRLESGQELDADIVITATGLNMLVFGGMSLSVDGQNIDLSQTVGYKGIMLGGIPNLAYTLGYTNASWTLKADLAASYVCRLLNHMDDHGYRRATPRAPDPVLPTVPFIDLTSGYVQRSIDALPRQGDRKPWRLNQNYALDVVMLRHGDMTAEMDFAGEPAAAGRDTQIRV